ncbi:hypothetical protein BJX62DRAFT_214323 [Aspergillus germanicus]
MLAGSLRSPLSEQYQGPWSLIPSLGTFAAFVTLFQDFSEVVLISSVFRGSLSVPFSNSFWYWWRRDSQPLFPSCRY